MAIKTMRLGATGTVAGLMTLWASSAFAGAPPYCGTAGTPACDAGVHIMPTSPGHSGPATVQNHTPYDFMDSIHFKRLPHVSITRIHGLDTKPDLKDSPIGFTKGCHPSSTAYCRTGATPPPVKPSPKPVTPPAPIVTAPPKIAQPPIVRPPVVQRPVINPCAVQVAPRPCGTQTGGRIVATAGHVDPSKFIPRIYGDPYTITPGVAYLPTSKVIRDPYQAQAVLDNGPGGVTPALSGLRITPHLPTPYYPIYSQSVRPVQPVSVGLQPAPQYPVHSRYPGPNSFGLTHGRYSGSQSYFSGGRYSQTSNHGAYWERVSGPTRFGNQIATEVVCRRQHPGYRPHPQSPCAAKMGSSGSRY